MIICFTPTSWEEYQYWQENDAKVVGRINLLIKDITRNPFKGLGKPEPLRGNLSGYWSRRISDEHRIVYRVEGPSAGQRLIIFQVRFHY